MKKIRFKPKDYNENIEKLKKLSHSLNSMIEEGSFYDLSFYHRYLRVRDVKRLYNKLRGPVSENKLNQAVSFASVLFMITGSSGCSDSSDDYARVTLDLGLRGKNRVEKNISRAQAPTDVTEIQLTVSGSDMDTIEESVPAATGILTLEIPPGDARLFTVQAETTGNDYFTGTAQTDLPAGSSVNVPITMLRNDLTEPSVSINEAALQTDPVSTTPITFDITFSEPIDPATFTIDDIVQNGTATGVTWNLENSGDNQNFTLTVTAVTGAGTIIPEIAVSTVQDLPGNYNAESISTDNTVIYDDVSPDATIEQAAEQDEFTHSLPITFDIVFNEPIDPSSFTVGDIVQNGTATGITWSLSNSGDNQNFTLTATAISGDGTIVPSIDAASVQDLADNDNAGSTSADNTVIYDDTIEPTVTVNQAGDQGDPGRNPSIDFDVVFDEPIDPATFTVGDIDNNGTTTGVTWSIDASGDDQNFKISTLTVSGDGYTVEPSIAAGTVSDPLGNTNIASTSTDNEVTFDPPSFNYIGNDHWGAPAYFGKGFTPAFADIDGDGDLDVFITQNLNNGYTFYLENLSDTTPDSIDLTPTVPYGLTNKYYYAKTLVDIDGDGDQDIFASTDDFNNPGYVNIDRAIVGFENIGSDTSCDFSASPTGVISEQFGEFPSFSPTFQAPMMTFADIDNDSDYDLFIGGIYPDSTPDLNYVQNEGDANNPIFNSAADRIPGLETADFNISNTYESMVPTFVDIDDDGDDDLFIGVTTYSEGYYNSELILYENTGTPTEPSFVGPVIDPFGISLGGNYSGNFPAIPVFADIDGDGDLDLFVSDYNGNLIYYENTNSGPT